MRILHVHTDLHGGGIESLLVALAEKQAEMGHDVGICYYPCNHGPPPHELTEHLRSLGIHLLPISAIHVMSPDYFFKLLLAVLRFKPAVLHLHGGTIGVIGALVGRLARVSAIIYTEHIPCYAPKGDTSSSHAAWIRGLRSLTAPLLHYTVAISNAVEQTLPRTTRHKCVIYNGVDDRKFSVTLSPLQRQRIRQSVGLPPDCTMAIGIGALMRRKGYDIMLSAMSLLASEHNFNLHFVVCGKGSEAEALRRQAANSGLADFLHLLGWRSDVPNLLAAADIFVHPTRSEGFGLVVVEAMLAGLPVIATRIGGIPEIITDGVTGLLVPPDNPPALARALKKVLQDKAFAQALARRARQEALKRFTVSKMAEQYLSLYNSILQRQDPDNA